MSGLEVERDGAVVTFRLSKARGNAIDEALVDALARATDNVARDDSVRAVILASANPKIFCPGFDLISLVEYDRTRMTRFITKFAETVRALYRLPKPVVAALNGHAVAGGCILSLTADYRVLKRGGAQIGLNEVRVGVPLPWAVSVLLRATVAPPALARVALLGRNFSDDAALAVGLVDEVADADGFEATCRARVAEFMDKHAGAFATTKAYLRADAVAAMSDRPEAAVGGFLDGWFSDETRERVGRIVASLKS